MSETIEKLKDKLKENKPFQIKIKVIAGAKQNSVEEFYEDIIKVKIDKPAVDGKANKAIIEYFSKLLNIPKKNVTILRGEKNSLKDLLIVPKNTIIM